MRLKQRSWLLSAVLVALLQPSAHASRIDDLIAALAGKNEPARSLARQLLPREGIQVVPRILPLLRAETAAVREAAFNVLADIANEASAPGHEADRAAVTARLMSLLQPDQPAQIKIRGLRLLPIVIPPDSDVRPVAALLSDRELRERAREALEETGTAASRTALRTHLAHADPDFACALLNSLGRLHDREGLDSMTRLTADSDPRVRVAAARALVWTGDPAYLKSVRRVVDASDPATWPDAVDAMLRMLLCMEGRPAHRDAAIGGYRFLLERRVHGQVKDGALAGLGRVGDAACVPVILEAIRDDEPPTLLVGMNALGALPGKDVTQNLINAYPSLPKPAQLALIPILGARHDALVLPLLQQLAQSDRADTHIAALQALGETDLAEAMKLLSVEETRGDPAQRAKIREIIEGHKLREMERRQLCLPAGARDADLLGLLGIIGRWWLVGPFDLGEGNQGWATRYIGEPDVSVVARYMAGKTRRQWKRVESQDPHGKIDLRSAIADRDNCIGYAYAEFELPKSVDALLLVGVDDSEKIWVNGSQVFQHFTARGLVVDQDHVPVHLKAGTNTILLKVYQNTLGWEFCARLVTPDGKPLPLKQKAD
jgi:HEAT repeat protein